MPKAKAPENDPRETPVDDPRQQTDLPTHRQTDQPWQGNPEKEQIDPKRPRLIWSDGKVEYPLAATHALRSRVELMDGGPQVAALIEIERCQRDRQVESPWTGASRIQEKHSVDRVDLHPMRMS